MLDAFPERAEATDAQTPVRSGLFGVWRQKTIQCRQCSEHFSIGTMICPRCNRWNDRSLVAFSLKILAAVIFIGTVSWTAWAISKIDDPPRINGSLKPLPKSPPTVAGQPDLRF